MTIKSKKGAGCLYVRMFGEFTMEFEGRAVLRDEKQSSRMFHLLQILLYEGQEGIGRDQLLLRLYGRERTGDHSNNLRVTIHHLRKLLSGSSLPKEEFIQVQGGRYRFESSFPIEVDARIFAGLLQAAKGVQGQKRMDILKEACGMYQGYFLPPLAGEEWVAVEEAHYQKLYVQSMEELCKVLQKQKEYKELLKWCSQAAFLYPYDEWQLWQVDCLAALGRMEEALVLCEKTTKMYLEEPGVTISEHMFANFREMGKRVQTSQEDLQEILDTFREKEQLSGGYHCSYPGFVDSCRLAARMTVSFGRPAYVLLCTISDGRKRHPLASGGLSELSKKLEESIQEALGQEDAFIRYSKRQFLALLPGVSREECQRKIGRIDAGFRSREKSRRVCVTYRMARISEKGSAG